MGRRFSCCGSDAPGGEVSLVGVFRRAFSAPDDDTERAPTISQGMPSTIFPIDSKGSRYYGL